MRGGCLREELEGLVGAKALRQDRAWGFRDREEPMWLQGVGEGRGLSHMLTIHMHLFINSIFTAAPPPPGVVQVLCVSTHTPRPHPTSQHTQAWESLAHLKHNPGFLKQVLGGYGTRDHTPGKGGAQLARLGSQWAGWG